MSDSYQAIYDAVRSRISNGDVGSAIAEVAHRSFDISHSVQIVQQEYCIAASEQQRPSVLFRPTLSRDGNMWCALYGDDLHSGIAGFGETADKAMRAFDIAFANEAPEKQTIPLTTPHTKS